LSLVKLGVRNAPDTADALTSIDEEGGCGEANEGQQQRVFNEILALLILNKTTHEFFHFSSEEVSLNRDSTGCSIADDCRYHLALVAPTSLLNHHGAHLHRDFVPNLVPERTAGSSYQLPSFKLEVEVVQRFPTARCAVTAAISWMGTSTKQFSEALG
jgi:hypothetical protein